MKRFYLLLLTLLVIGIAAGLHLYLNQANSIRPTCHGCGQIQPEIGYKTASQHLENEYPEIKYTVIQDSATMFRCGSCEGTAPTAFLVERNNQTEGFIATINSNVIKFSENMSKAPTTLKHFNKTIKKG